MAHDILVRFFDRAFAPVRLPLGGCLAEHLDVTNSPLLFGCRTGICGTCLVRIEGDLPPPGDDEKELLDLLAPGDPRARLACQVELTSDVCVEPHPEAA
jgi:ferredoxin